jgi:hypothetical protein
MKRTYSAEELKSVNNSMASYTVSFEYLGKDGTVIGIGKIKVNVEMTGNHFDIIDNIVKQHYGNNTTVIGAKITGKNW